MQTKEHIRINHKAKAICG